MPDDPGVGEPVHVHHVSPERLHRLIARRSRSNVAVAIRELVPAERVEELVTIVTALVDGFWLRYVIDGPVVVPPEVGRRLCRQLLSLSLAAGAAPQAMEGAGSLPAAGRARRGARAFADG